MKYRYHPRNRVVSIDIMVGVHLYQKGYSMTLNDYWFRTEKFYSMIVGAGIHAQFWYMDRPHRPTHIDTYDFFGT